MADDRQDILLAVLKARGSAPPADLACHPVIRDHYHPFGRFEIQDDLEALVGAGALEAHSADVDGEPATLAYDVVGLDRPEWDARFHRAKKVVGELRSRETSA